MTRRRPVDINEERLAQRAVFSVSKILAEDLPQDEALRKILQVLCDQLDWVAASYWTVDESVNALRCEMLYSSQPYPDFQRTTAELQLRKGEGLPGRVWQERSPTWIPDVVVDPNFPRSAEAQNEGLHAAFAFPMSSRGKCIGVFEFFSNAVSGPNEDLLHAFAILDTVLGLVFERRRVENELAQQAKLSKFEANIGMALNQLNSLESILQTCADLTIRELDMALTQVWLCDEQGRIIAGKPVSANVSSVRTSEDPPPQFLDLLNSIAKEQQPQLKQALDDDKAEHLAIWGKQQGLSCFAGYPLSADGNVLGVLCIFAHQPISVPVHDVLLRMANNLASCIARKTFEEKLLSSEGRFREFASVVDEVFFVGSACLTEFYYVSPAYEKVWGQPASVVLADASAWRNAIIPEHLQRVIDYVSLLQGDNMPAESEIDYAIVSAHGRKKWVSARCFRIDQHDGSWHICGTVRDITDRKEAEERVSDFYSMVSHELRTPLTSIKGCLLLLERGRSLRQGPRAQELVVLARQESDRLIRLINDFLDIKTIQAGRLKLYCENLEPSMLIDQTLQTMVALTKPKKIKLRKHVTCQRAVFADRDRIIQVITNLLSNAIKFSPNDAQIDVSAEGTGDFIRFSVSDSGPGIPKEKQSKLFQVFQQIATKENAGKEGTGLGLAICQGIVHEHGGRIGVISDEGKGATFWFELPVSGPNLQ